MPRKEEPRIVHLVLNLCTIFIIGSITEGTMDISLLRVLAGVASGELAEKLVGFLVLGNVSGGW